MILQPEEETLKGEAGLSMKYILDLSNLTY